jgi:uncharacterized protein
MRAATKSGDVIRRETLRLALAAVHNEEVARLATLDDDAVRAVLGKQAKMRRESIEAFEKGGRHELAAKERSELAVIQSYLPAELERGEIEDAARRTIAAVGATGQRDQGKVMQRLMPELRGRAEGKVVAEIVSALLRDAEPRAPGGGAAER